MISVITPHYDDVEGIEQLITCFENQNVETWEWIIVDDISNEQCYTNIKFKISNSKISDKVDIIRADKKLFGGGCRNLGVKYANFNLLIFLDSDDFITPNFIQNRIIKFDEDFIVFSKFYIKNTNNNSIKQFSEIKSEFLINFLKARFPWQTTAILWKKEFFLKIGGFLENLERLQDIDLSVRALITSNNYKVYLNNEVDFYYIVNSIDADKRSFYKVSKSVKSFISNLLFKYNLKLEEKYHLMNYFYLDVRYFLKSNKKQDLKMLKDDLTFFKKQNIIKTGRYVLGFLIIYLFKWNLINHRKFLKINRKFFKKI